VSYIDWEKIHDDLIEQLMRDMPDSWDGDESAEHLVVQYVRAIERRLIALGGSLERYPEGDQ
jgi:hypothetical protein